MAHQWCAQDRHWVHIEERGQHRRVTVISHFSFCFSFHRFSHQLQRFKQPIFVCTLINIGFRMQLEHTSWANERLMYAYMRHAAMRKWIHWQYSGTHVSIAKIKKITKKNRNNERRMTGELASFDWFQTIFKKDKRFDLCWICVLIGRCGVQPVSRLLPTEKLKVCVKLLNLTACHNAFCLWGFFFLLRQVSNWW